MHSIKYQRGVTTLGFLTIALIGIFFVYTAFKVVPPYAENRYIVSALKSLDRNNDDVFAMSNGQIRDNIMRFYTVNNVSSEGSRNIDIERRSSRVIVTIAYEERVPFIANIDLVFNFKNQLDSAEPERCCKPIDE